MNHLANHGIGIKIRVIKDGSYIVNRKLNRFTGKFSLSIDQRVGRIFQVRAPDLKGALQFKQRRFDVCEFIGKGQSQRRRQVDGADVKCDKIPETAGERHRALPHDERNGQQE
ncbi:MAG: hypothetical protein IH820_12725 [Bacteroidetes bacterium]|nr:hypothetical protein [Bacteroidota bacterium]